MTKQIIGRVMMAFKGDYDATKQYNFLDTVEYNGSSFVCKANGTHDVPSESSANWQLLARAGKTPDTSVFALKSELPNLTPYAKKTDLPNLTPYAKKSDLPDLTPYAKRTEIPTIPEGFVSINNFGQVTKSQLTTALSYYTSPINADLPIKEWGHGFIIPYAKNSWAWARIIFVSGLTHRVWISITGNNADKYMPTDWVEIPNERQLSVFAKKSDLPSDVVKHSELKEVSDKANDAKTEADNNAKALQGKANKSDIPTSMPWSKITGKPSIPSTIDTSGFATKSEVQTVKSTANQAEAKANMAISNAQTALTKANQTQSKVDSLSAPSQVQTITSGTLAALANVNGVRHYEIDFSPSDGPVRDWGLCDVIVGSHYAKQIFVNSGNKSGDCYVRIRDYDGNWSDWREITAWN